IASNVADYDFGSPDVQPTTTVDVTDTLPGVGPWTGPATFDYSYNLSGTEGTCVDKNNTATITQTGQTASKTVTLCIAKDPTLTRTPFPPFPRTYKWSVAKGVDKTLVEQFGGNATFIYAVTATQKGYTD